MAPEYLKGLVFVLGLAAVILAAAAFGEWYVQRKLERWARTNGLRLLEFSGAPFNSIRGVDQFNRRPILAFFP
jgi:hypothetical protein